MATLYKLSGARLRGKVITPGYEKWLDRKYPVREALRILSRTIVAMPCDAPATANALPGSGLKTIQ